MVASTANWLPRIIEGLHETANRYDMKINVKKAKVLKISKNEGGLKIVIDGQAVDQVNKFIYLRQWFTNDGRCDTEISMRIGMAKHAISKRREWLIKRMNDKEEDYQVLDLVGEIVYSVILVTKKGRYKKIGSF